MKKEYDENTDQESTITELLYIDGFRYDDVDKVLKINKMVQQRIDKRVKLVQDVINIHYGSLEYFARILCPRSRLINYLRTLTCISTQ